MRSIRCMCALSGGAEMVGRIALVSFFLLTSVACGGSPTVPSGPTVLSVSVTTDTGATGTTFNNNSALPAQATLSLTATARFSDGTSRAITTEATWTSSNSGIATVAGGIVTVNRRINGSATITATFRSINGTFQVNVAVL